MVGSSEAELYNVEAEFYDEIYDFVDDIPLYMEYAKSAGGLVLECGVGTGRVAIPLAKAGINIVGIDLNQKMLAIACEKLAKEHAEVRKRVKLVEADMRNFRLKERFSLATIPFNAFLHMLTVEDQEATLKSIHKHLKPNGRLIIYVFNPDLTRIQNVVRLEKVKQVKDQVIMRFATQSFDFPNQTTTVQWIYDFVKSDGSVKRHVLSPLKLRYLFYDEMRQLLARTGYETETVYGDEKKAPFQSNSRLMIFVARKSAPKQLL
jgi:ubiquinone/menaquinone biosynthesis C-methylase UbiE